jgi:hypothetical protein|tara:strand:+ start:119 stop:427 length:309 start_codon:yes stop_codon:yes gene_type:complete
LKSEEQKEVQTEENNVDVAAARTIEANEKKDAEREAEEQFKKKTIQKYTSMMPDQGQVLTKDRAYLASSKIIAHFKEFKGAENSHYLAEYFKKTWDDHDKDE